MLKYCCRKSHRTGKMHARFVNILFVCSHENVEYECPFPSLMTVFWADRFFARVLLSTCHVVDPNWENIVLWITTFVRPKTVTSQFPSINIKKCGIVCALGGLIWRFLLCRRHFMVRCLWRIRLVVMLCFDAVIMCAEWTFLFYFEGMFINSQDDNGHV